MPFDMRVIVPQDFVRVDRYGDFDLEATRQMLRVLFQACADSHIPRILVDVRRFSGEVAFKDVAMLAENLGDLGMDPSFKMAVLHRPRRHHAEFLAENAQHRGWQVRAFDSFEDAFEWLNEITVPGK